MSAPARILLFDVDGTLVHAGGAGRRAVGRALLLHVGRIDGSLAGLRLDGMTDRLIVREAMLGVGHPFDEGLCDRILDTYADRLEQQIRGPGYRVLPGVERLLAELAARRVAIGLCTGNILRGARIKLARGGLDRHFGFEEGDVYGFACTPSCLWIWMLASRIGRSLSGSTNSIPSLRNPRSRPVRSWKEANSCKLARAMRMVCGCE